MTAPLSNVPTADILGYRVALLDLQSAAATVVALSATHRDRTALVLTLNPEIVVRATGDTELKEALSAAALTVADGVGILWAARRKRTHLPGRVAGVELTEAVLRSGGSALRTYYLGGRPGVAEAAASAAHDRFGSNVAGCHHGYFADGAEAEAVAHLVRSSGAQLLLCALGERQERFVHRYGHLLGAEVAVGVGGTLDVLAGVAARPPPWTRRLHLEWLWRVGLDPKRWHRVPRLVRFVGLVLRS